MSTLVDFRNHIFEKLEDIHYILDNSGFYCDIEQSMESEILRYELSPTNFIYIETFRSNPDCVDICYNKGGEMVYANSVKVGDELLKNLRKNIYYYILSSKISELKYKSAKFMVLLEQNDKKVLLSNSQAKKLYLKKKKEKETSVRNRRSTNHKKSKDSLDNKKPFTEKKGSKIFVHKYKLTDKPVFMLDYSEITFSYCELSTDVLSSMVFCNVTDMKIENCTQLDDLMWLKSFPNLKRLIVDSPKKRTYPDSSSSCFIQYK